MNTISRHLVKSYHPQRSQVAFLVPWIIFESVNLVRDECLSKNKVKGQVNLQVVDSHS